MIASSYAASQFPCCASASNGTFLFIIETRSVCTCLNGECLPNAAIAFLSPILRIRHAAICSVNCNHMCETAN